MIAPGGLNPFTGDGTMNVSSVSSYSSTQWEEYLEELKKKQLQKNSGTSSGSSVSGAGTSQSALSPDAIISELQSIQDDPEKLKARAAELAAEASKEAGNSVGIKADMLNELAADLETVAESGDLSAMLEKAAKKPGGMGAMGFGPSGASGVSSSLTQALLEEDEEEDEEEEDDISASTLENIKSLLAEIQKLIEKEESSDSSGPNAFGSTPEEILSELESLQDSEALKTRASELAGQLYAEAGETGGRRADMLEELASDLETVAESGDLSALREKIERRRPNAASAPGHSGTGASIGLDSLVSKFQAIKETRASEALETSETGEEDAAGYEGAGTSIDELISRVKINLTDQLQALYVQTQGYSSTVSLSG
jgi:hypothetical protein